MRDVSKDGAKRKDLGLVIVQIEQYDFFYKELLLNLLSTDQSKIKHTMLRSIIRLKVENSDLDKKDYLTMLNEMINDPKERKAGEGQSSQIVLDYD